MKTDDFILVSENIAILKSQDYSCFEPTPIKVQDLQGFEGNVSLPIAHSEAVIIDQSTSIKLLFGSWIESGDEDKQLEELYKSRLLPSASINE